MIRSSLAALFLLLCASCTHKTVVIEAPLAPPATDALRGKQACFLLVDENTLYRWDGTKWPIEGWDQDLTAAQRMKESAVWYTQKLIPQVGMKRVKEYSTTSATATRT